MSDLEKSVESLHDKLDELNEKMATIPHRVLQLEKIVYGAIKLILVAFVVSLIFLVIPENNKPVSANTNIIGGK